MWNRVVAIAISLMMLMLASLPATAASDADLEYAPQDREGRSFAAGATEAVAAEPRTDPLPNSERPLVHQELLTIRGERGRYRAWGPATLVVDTILERDQRLRGDEESGRGAAGFGSLARDGSHPGDPVVLASEAVAGGYPPNGSPVSGLLAFNDRAWEAIGMYLEGTVETPTGTYLTPIDPTAMVVADTLPVGALIVARGWFTRLRAQGSCPAVPRALDPNDTGGRESAFVRCPGGWLTADGIVELDPDDPTSPLAFGIPVQSGVLEQFTRRNTEDAAGTPVSYLLRHVANPVQGAEPAIGWKVIGRVDPMSIPDLDSPSGSDEVVRPGGLDWQPGMERQPPADQWSIHSTAWAGGFSSAHLGSDRVLSAWVSSDGTNWQGAELPTGIRSVGALLRLRGGLVIIANEQHYDAVWRYEVWSSSDGLEWKRSSRQRVPMPKRFDGYRRNVQGFWSLGDRVLALATYTTQRCCGRSSGWTVVANQKQEPDVTFAWTSRDGKTWKRHRTSGIPSNIEDHFGYLINQGDGELLATWGGAGGSIGRTTNGVDWRTIGRMPEALDVYSQPRVLRADDGLVLGGSVEVSGRNREQMTFWHSTDGRRWIRTFGRFGGRPAAMASSGGTVIVAGNDGYSSGTGLKLPWLMLSEDGGRTWDEALAWVGDTELCLESLTVNGSAVSVDARCAPPDAASTYVGELPAGGAPR